MAGVNLREVSSEALHRELRLRMSCLDCGSIFASHWRAAGLNRLRCKECHKLKISRAGPVRQIEGKA